MSRRLAPAATMGVHLAIDHIRTGLADMALIVGVEKLYSDDRAKRFAVFQQPLDIVEAAGLSDAHRGPARACARGRG